MKSVFINKIDMNDLSYLKYTTVFHSFHHAHDTMDAHSCLFHQISNSTGTSIYLHCY